MDSVYILAEDLDKWILRHLPEKDIFSIDDILAAMEEMDSEINSLREEYEELERDLEDNYRPLPRSEYTGDSYDDRF